MPTFDASSSAYTSSGALSLSWSHTCTGSNRLLLVKSAASGGGTSLSAATYNSVSRDAELWDYAIAGDFYSHACYFIDPASGTNTIQITVNGGSTGDLWGHADSFTDRNTSTPLGTVAEATGTTAAPSVAPSSASGDLIWDGVSCIGSGSPTALSADGGQTDRYNVTNGGWNRHCCSTKAGAAGTTMMSWTITSGPLTAWHHGAVAIKAVAASGGPNLLTLLGVG